MNSYTLVPDSGLKHKILEHGHSGARPRACFGSWPGVLAQLFLVIVLLLSSCGQAGPELGYTGALPGEPSRDISSDRGEEQPPPGALVLRIHLAASFAHQFQGADSPNYVSMVPRTTLYIAGLDPHWPEMSYSFGPFLGSGSSSLEPGLLRDSVSVTLTWYGGGGEEIFLAQEEGELRLYRQFLEEISPDMLQSLEADGQEYVPPGPELYYSQALEPGQPVWIDEVREF